MKYLLGIDFGGGASKATLLGTDGRIYAESSVEYPTLHPANGACEQSPEDWIGALKTNITEILGKSRIDPREILSLALSSATHTFLICDEAYRPLRPAIHWTDSRSGAESAELREKYGDMIFEKAFHRPDTIWTLPQLIWLRREEPEIFEKAAHLFFEKDYIRYYLTGVHCTDYIEAEGSMLFDCRKMEWSEELCALAGISEKILPEVVEPGDVIGRIAPAAARETGLSAGTPVICGTTDTCMEIFAAGAVREGDMTVKLATAGRICVITPQPHPDRNLVNYSHIKKGLWYPGTATKSCAASFRWYRDTFGGDYQNLMDAAASIPLGCEGMIFHPYLNGELTPYADPALCGSFTGVRATHTRAHFTRAVLEGVCYSLLDCKLALDQMGISYGEIATGIGGGMKQKFWRQMASDVLGIRLRTTESGDSSFGSAMLAGISAGVFANPSDAVEKCVKFIDFTEPDPARGAEYRRVFEEYKKIHDALAPIYDERAKK